MKLKRMTALLLSLALILSLTVVPAAATDADVTLTITPNKTEIDTSSGDAEVEYTIEVKVASGVSVGGIQFTLVPPSGMTLGTEKGTGYITESLKYDEDYNPNGIFASYFSYTPSTKVFIASGTTQERNLSTDTKLMTIKAKVAQGTTGSLTLSANDVAFSKVGGEGKWNYTVKTTEVKLPKPALTGTVTITGTAKIGKTLTANADVTTTDAGTLTYKWYRGDDVITGATSKTYTPVAADVGKQIKVEVTAANCSGSLTSNKTDAVLKKDGPAAPKEPKVTAITHNSATVTNAVTGQEYGIVNTAGAEIQNWKSPENGKVVFTGLTPSTQYYIYARYKETEDTCASEPSTPYGFKTLEAPLTGSVTISGTAKIGETLTANTTINISGEGALSFKWSRDGEVIDGATGETYTLTVADLGKKIKVEVTAANCTGSLISTETAAVVKKDAPAAPGMPTLSSTDTTVIVANAVTGQEYAIVSTVGAEIQKWELPKNGKVAFEGLTPNKWYYVYTRVAETADTDAGKSTSASIQTTRTDCTITITSGDLSKTYDGTAVADPNVSTNSTETPTYTYYTDAACTVKTTVSGSGAATEGGAPKNVGSYWVKASVAQTQTYKAAESEAKAFTIAKATAPTLTTPDVKNVPIKYAQTGVEVDLASLVSSYDGAAIKSATEESDADSIISNISKDGCKVKFDVASIAAAGKTATIKVTFEFTNYADAEVTLTVKTTRKINAEVEIYDVPATVTYGDTFTLKARTTTEGVPADGTWSWRSTDESVLKIVSGGNTNTVTVKALKAFSTGDPQVRIIATYESSTYEDDGIQTFTKVEKAAVTVKAVNQSIYVNGTAPDLSSPVKDTHYTVTGLVNGDTLASVTMEYKKDGSAVTPDVTKAGTYDIVITATADADKYVVTNTSGTLTVSTKSSGSSGGGGGSASYAITVESGKHGTVSVSPKSASSGSTVTVTVTPDAGYTLETLTVLDKNGKEITVTAKNGKYTFTMPAGKVSVKATFMEDNTMLNFFVDVPASKYYYDAVLWAVRNGITNGLDETHFAPDLGCTRAQIVTFLWRAAGCPEPTTLKSFSDVAADSYYAKAVAWAVENGITKGVTETEFMPNVTCTRAHAVTFLYREKGCPAVNSSTAFVDVTADRYYADAVAWAVEHGVTNGVDAAHFYPDLTCTRAQIVTFLYRCANEQ